jgi:hypothetical protein
MAQVPQRVALVEEIRGQLLITREWLKFFVELNGDANPTGDFTGVTQAQFDVLEARVTVLEAALAALQAEVDALADPDVTPPFDPDTLLCDNTGRLLLDGDGRILLAA